ncbi:MAG: peptidoglycan-binding protein [Asticcacaulis sp.]|nr:peptidoglycan-binding protein [Asticcacaulis sp.]
MILVAALSASPAGAVVKHRPAPKPVATTVVAKPASAKPPIAKPQVSDSFKAASRVAAERTVQVLQKGTSDAPPQAPDTRLPPVDAHDSDEEAAGVIACKDKGDKDPALKDLPADVRANAKPGECYARLLSPPQMEAVTDHVLVTPEHTEKRVIPAVVQEIDKDVLVRPERVERRVIPAVTATRTETEVVREATVREDVVPAIYETRMVHELVEPAHQEWVKGAGEALDAPMVTPVDHAPVRYRDDGYLTWPGKDREPVPTTDEARDYLKDGNPPVVWYLNEVPALYRDVRKRVMVQPESTRRVDIPAVTRQVTRVVVVEPEHVEERIIPAVYEKRRVKDIVTPERTETYTVPAVYKDMQTTRVTQPADAVWRRVLCRRNASPALVTHIQQALQAKGYNPGALDGHLGAQTVQAMQKFQADNNLPQGQISLESVKALGINPELNDAK